MEVQSSGESKIYKSIVGPVIVYTSETRAETLKTSQLVRRIEISLLRVIAVFVHCEIEYLIKKYEVSVV